jgi:DNA-binding PadR family transcriptional regulator
VSATRLLILGAVRLVQPAHGYRIRQELERWEAENWAPIKYATIYHALHSMLRDGLLTEEEDSEGAKGPAKRLYRLTPAGEAAYAELLRENWLNPAPSYDPLQLVLSFRPDLEPKDFEAGLVARITSAQETISHLGQRQGHSPPHVAANMKLVIAQLRVFIDWAQEQLADQSNTDTVASGSV